MAYFIFFSINCFIFLDLQKLKGSAQISSGTSHNPKHQMTNWTLGLGGSKVFNLIFFNLKKYHFDLT